MQPTSGHTAGPMSMLVTRRVGGSSRAAGPACLSPAFDFRRVVSLCCTTLSPGMPSSQGPNEWSMSADFGMTWGAPLDLR